MWQKGLLAVAVAATALAVAGVAWLWLRGGPPPAEDAAAAAGKPVLEAFLIERPQRAVQAEPFTAHPVNGASPRLEDYLGRYVLLNFWATWCKPCQEEMPALEALYREVGPERLVVVAVSMQEEVSKVRKYIEDSDYTFPVLADPDGAVSRLYGVNSIPLTYLIDPGGEIVGRALGPREWNDPRLREYFRRQSGAG